MPSTLDKSLVIDRAVVKQASDFSQTDARLEAVAPNGRTELLPRELGGILDAVIEAMASGATVTIGTLPRELTTTEAARQLGISRPTLMKLVKEGSIPSHKVGSHTRLMRDDVLGFRDERRKSSRDIFEKRRELEDQIEFDS